jgi:hypothetical protein
VSTRFDSKGFPRSIPLHINISNLSLYGQHARYAINYKKHSICREIITGKNENGIADGLLWNLYIVNMTGIFSNNIPRAHIIKSI